MSSPTAEVKTIVKALISLLFLGDMDQYIHWNINLILFPRPCCLPPTELGKGMHWAYRNGLYRKSKPPLCNVLSDVETGTYSIFSSHLIAEPNPRTSQWKSEYIPGFSQKTSDRLHFNQRDQRVRKLKRIMNFYYLIQIEKQESPKRHPSHSAY